ARGPATPRRAHPTPARANNFTATLAAIRRRFAANGAGECHTPEAESGGGRCRGKGTGRAIGEPRCSRRSALPRTLARTSEPTPHAHTHAQPRRLQRRRPVVPPLLLRVASP